MRSNGIIIGPKRTVSVSSAPGIWAIRDAQRERGANNWPHGIPIEYLVIAGGGAGGGGVGIYEPGAGGGARRTPAHPLVGGSSGVYGCVCERERRQWSMLPTQRANALSQRLDSHGICYRRTGD